jgi:hypothetical protein
VRVSFRDLAGEHERYMPHAFDSCVGQDVPFRIAGAERGRAVVVSVTVDEDGRGATWTVDITGGDETRIPVKPVSFAVPEPAPEPADPLAAKPPKVTWRGPDTAP